MDEKRVPPRPLWKLEMERDQALRRFHRAREETIRAGSELSRIEGAIKLRRMEYYKHD
jgi:hypothetical protein